MEYLLLKEKVGFRCGRTAIFIMSTFRLGNMTKVGFSLGQPLLGIEMNYRGLCLGKLLRDIVPGSKVLDHQRSNFLLGFLEATEFDRELALVPNDNLDSQGK